MSRITHHAFTHHVSMTIIFAGTIGLYRIGRQAWAVAAIFIGFRLWA